MKVRIGRLVCGLFVLLMLSGVEGLAQVANEDTKLGPVTFHVVPELGAGVLLRDDQVIGFDASDGFFMVRIPGLRFPGWNQTVTGVQVEFTQAPTATPGAALRYDILSYTRTKVAGPMFTGANLRIARGTTDTGTELGARVMPVVGVRMFTIAERVPFVLEVELFDQNRPVKALIIVTWK